MQRRSRGAQHVARRFLLGSSSHALGKLVERFICTALSPPGPWPGRQSKSWAGGTVVSSHDRLAVAAATRIRGRQPQGSNHRKEPLARSCSRKKMQQDDLRRSPVRVVVRMREGAARSDDIRLEPDGKSITLRQTSQDVSQTAAKQELLSFTCDATLDNASQDRTFDVVGRPAVDACLAGFNGTVLCYGQTGAGKSFTMVGSRERYQQRGLIPRAIGHVFKAIEADTTCEYSIKFSCLEIYNDQMYDLLSTLPSDGPRQELSLAEHRGKVEVKGLLAPECETEEAALQCLFEAESNRAVAQHQLNQLSSRSHVLYMIRIDKRSKVANGALVSCRLTLVDLAGSERLKKAANTATPLEFGGTGAFGAAPQDGAAKQLPKGMSINKSLSFFEQVVVALAKRSARATCRTARASSPRCSESPSAATARPSSSPTSGPRQGTSKRPSRRSSLRRG